jgi:hypothetical protein
MSESEPLVDFLFTTPGADGFSDAASEETAQLLRKKGEDFGGYFSEPEEAEAFERELSYLLHSERLTLPSGNTTATDTWVWDFTAHAPLASSTQAHPHLFTALKEVHTLPEFEKVMTEKTSPSNISLTDDFMDAMLNGGSWRVNEETRDAIELWDMLASLAWQRQDTGVRYDTIINDWNPTPNTERIEPSQGAYQFLDNSAAHGAYLNLILFLDEEGRFDIDAYRQAIRIAVVALDILVDYSGYPTETIAQVTHDYRPLILGFTNLESLLQSKDIAIGSPESLAIAGALTAILTAKTYGVSAEIAARKGAFNGYAINRDPMLRVMTKHRAAAYEIDSTICPEPLLEAAREDWDEAIKLGETFGYRNAQATALELNTPTDSPALDWLRLASAMQPFVSGAINQVLPLGSQTQASELADLYLEGWKMGLKSITVHRDPLPVSQPVQTPVPSHTQRVLANERSAVIHQFNLSGTAVSLIVSFFDESTPAELFIRLQTTDPVLSPLLDAYAAAVSLALQHGTPLTTLVDQFTGLAFAPAGSTDNPAIPLATSIIDYTARWLSYRFIKQTGSSQELV